MNIYKKFFIIVLIFGFLLNYLAIWGRAFAAIPTTTDQSWFNTCRSESKSSHPDLQHDNPGYKVVLNSVTATKTSENKYKLNLSWSYSEPSSIKYRNYTIKQFAVLPRTEAIGSTGNRTLSLGATSAEITISGTPNQEVPVRVNGIFCQRVDADEIIDSEYAFDWHYGSNQKIVKLPASGSTEPPTISDGEGGRTSDERTMPAEGTECNERCKLSFTEKFSISKQIGRAICEVQCAIINWLASLICLIVVEVLYPSLGIEESEEGAIRTCAEQT